MSTKRSSAFEDATRCCYLCNRELPLDCFRTITQTTRQGGRIYKYVTPSHDCRDCNKEYKREQRRKKAEATGRKFVPRYDRAAYAAYLKLHRRVAWAVCLAFRTLVKLTHDEAIARSVARQRVRYNTDPTYQAARKALKIRRKRAQKGTQVVPVNREIVAERDRWRCGICGGKVTMATWSLDHVIPLSKGGPHTYENVVLAHRSCNSKRGAGRLAVQAPLFALMSARAPHPRGGGLGSVPPRDGMRVTKALYPATASARDV